MEREPDYPKALYRTPSVKDDDHPGKDIIYATAEKNEAELREQGWGDYTRRDYPRMLYAKKTRATLTVKSSEEEMQALDEGWLSEPQKQHYGEEQKPDVHPPGFGPMGEDAKALDARLAEQDARMDEQQRLIAKQAELIDKLLAEREKKRK